MRLLLQVIVISFLLTIVMFLPDVFADGTWTNFTNADHVYDTVRVGDTLWCATYGGLVKWNLRDSTYVKYTTAEGLPDICCTSVAVDKKGILWIASGGIVSFDGESFTRYQDVEGIFPDDLDDIEISPQNDIWAIAYDGVVRYDGETWTFFGKDVGISEYVRDIDIDPSGNVWVATDYGLRVFDGSSWSVYTNYDVLPYQQVTAVTHDNHGNLYIGNIRVIYDGSTWMRYEIEEEDFHNFVRSLCVVGDTLWISKEWDIIALDLNTMQIINDEDFSFDLHFESITPEEYGYLWFSTYTGLYRFDHGELVKYPMDESICSSSVNDITIDMKGQTWIATNNGMSCYDGVSWRSYYQEDGLFSNTVYSIAASPNGDVWTSHFDALSRFDGYTWESIYNDDMNGEKSIAFDKNGILWIGSSSSKIFRYDGQNFKIFINPVDAGYNPIQDITFDDKGNIWCATHQTGIAKISFENTGEADWEFITTEMLYHMTMSLESYWPKTGLFGLQLKEDLHLMKMVYGNYGMSQTGGSKMLLLLPMVPCGLHPTVDCHIMMATDGILT